MSQSDLKIYTACRATILASLYHTEKYVDIQSDCIILCSDEKSFLKSTYFYVIFN